MFNYLFATGAYGREASKADWESGKDFRITGGGPYFSIRDTKALIRDCYVGIIFLNKAGKKAFIINF